MARIKPPQDCHAWAIPVPRISQNGFLRNSDIAELLALAAEDSKMPLQKALKRASRKALMWLEEAALILQDGRSLTELPTVGPTLNRIIHAWIEDPPSIPRPPEIRQHFLTATETQNVLAKKPDWAASVNGDLQMHTVWSDGSGCIEDMARAALDRGYQFIAITDHSKGLKIAGGINEQQLEQQAEEIRSVNAKLQAEGARFQVLRSIELNLSPAGDWEKVFAVAAELDKAVEIDGYPDRQDLSLDLLKLAKKSGCRISLGTDSHDSSQLRFMDYSLAAAIRAEISRDRILNFMSVDELRAWVEHVRSSSPA
jgi:histidinol phosphatase-like PHP family hydrolase